MGASGALEHQRFGGEELLEPDPAELASVTGLLEPAEGRLEVGRGPVDADLTGADAACEPLRAARVGRPDSAGEPVVAVVRDPKGIRLVVVREDAQDRSEDLLLRDPHRGLDVGERGGSDVVTALESFGCLQTAGDE